MTYSIEFGDDEQLWIILRDGRPVVWVESGDYWEALAALQELNADVVVEFP